MRWVLKNEEEFARQKGEARDSAAEARTPQKEKEPAISVSM